MLQETEAPAGMQGIKEGSAPDKLQTTERAKHPLQGRQQHVALVRAPPQIFPGPWVSGYNGHLCSCS